MMKARHLHFNSYLVGLLGAIVAFFVSHGRVTPYNNYVLFADALLHGRLWIDPLWPGPSIDAVLFDGHRFIVNDPLPGLLMLPFVAVFGTHASQTFLACVLCGVAVGAAWELFARLGVRERLAMWLSVFFLLGTDLLWCSMLGDVWFIAQTACVAFTLLALCELAGKRRGWLVAFWFALAIGSRFTVVMALPVVLWWIYDGFLERERRPRALGSALLTLLPFGLAWIVYNVLRWHVPWDAGHTIFYHQDPYLGSATGSPFGLQNIPLQLWSFFVNAPELTNSPPYLIPSQLGTALWFTSPALLLALFARRPRRLVISLWIAVGLVAGPSLLYYVNGGAQFGMRHALDFEPFVLVLMGLAARDGLGLIWRMLIVWSAAAGAWGCWYWNVYVRPTM
jgi:4-amino-4-deoxy-L-arabinose transferase-like glycosyltransferase